MPIRHSRHRSSQSRSIAAPALPDFIGRLGHELRTPLNAILGFSELMSVGTFGPLRNPRYVEYTKLIHLSAAQLLAMIDGLQRLAQLQAGGVALKRVPVDLALEAHGALESVGAPAARRRVLLRIEKSRSAAQILGDRDLLREMIGELVRNAVSFTPDGGRVTLRVHATRGGAVRLVIEDTGIGIAARDRARVFEPFFQIKPEGIPAPEGPGLGLSIAQAIAALHGATLTLRAGAGNAGTSAILTWPATKAGPAIKTRRAAAKPGSSSKRSR